MRVKPLTVARAVIILFLPLIPLVAGWAIKEYILPELIESVIGDDDDEED